MFNLYLNVYGTRYDERYLRWFLYMETKVNQNSNPIELIQEKTDNVQNVKIA